MGSWAKKGLGTKAIHYEDLAFNRLWSVQTIQPILPMKDHIYKWLNIYIIVQACGFSSRTQLELLCVCWGHLLYWVYSEGHLGHRQIEQTYACCCRIWKEFMHSSPWTQTCLINTVVQFLLPRVSSLTNRKCVVVIVVITALVLFIGSILFLCSHFLFSEPTLYSSAGSLLIILLQTCVLIFPDHTLHSHPLPVGRSVLVSFFSNSFGAVGASQRHGRSMRCCVFC